MKFSSFVLLTCSFFLSMMHSGCQIGNPDLFESPYDNEPTVQAITSDIQLVPDQYIVLLNEDSVHLPLSGNTERDQAPASRTPGKDEIRNEYKTFVETMTATCENILQANRVSTTAIQKVFTGAQAGMVVKLSEAEKNQLLNDPSIATIEQDQLIALSDFEPHIKTPFNPANNGNGSNGQSTPYGVSRVGGTYDFQANSQYNYRWAWIIDTGIDNHSELRLVNPYSTNFSNDIDENDNFGHGTHVAGIVGAKNDNSGVVGVASGVFMVNIKVLNQNGVGYASDIVSALNYISLYVWPEDVINMSIGGSASNILDNAVLALANTGVKIVVAAGNAAQDVSQYSPARIQHPNVYVVGSIDNSDTYSYFSNYGNGIDYVAPGDGILSTYGDDNFAVSSGTSMAAPHVTGVLLSAPNTYSTDGNSSPAPDGSTFPVIYR